MPALVVDFGGHLRYNSLIKETDMKRFWDSLLAAFVLAGGAVLIVVAVALIGKPLGWLYAFLNTLPWWVTGLSWVFIVVFVIVFLVVLSDSSDND